jgi:hypothetical protein
MVAAPQEEILERSAAQSASARGLIIPAGDTPSATPQGPPAGHSKDNPEGVNRFASQTEPRELTNRRFQSWVTAIHHDQRTPHILPAGYRGSAPTIAGRGQAQPDWGDWSISLLLDHLGH